MVAGRRAVHEVNGPQHWCPRDANPSCCSAPKACSRAHARRRLLAAAGIKATDKKRPWPEGAAAGCGRF